MDHSSRIGRLRIELRNRRLDAIVVSHLPNLRYLTGFTGSHGVAVVSREHLWFFTDFRYQEQIRTEVFADTSVVQKGDLFACEPFRKVIRRFHAVAFEHAHVTVAEYGVLRGSGGSRRWKPTEGIVEQLRAVKDEDEIADVRTAAGITDRVFQEMLGKIRPGMSELDCAAEISSLQRSHGAENDAFEIIVASGNRGALPHASPSLKKFAAGEFITLDFGCIVNGYRSDMTRTVCIGSATKEMKRVYRTVLEAQQLAIEQIHEGASAKRIDTIARSHIASAGYGQFFGHSLGHGVGLEIHEDLRLSRQSTERLRSGNVVTVEPGVYLPSRFGVRIEDMALVRPEGAELLTGSPKELLII